MPFPFDRTYMQLALAAALVVGAVAPLIGTFLVQRRQSLMGDGIGHLAFAGVAAGLLTGVWPVWTALGVAVAGAVLVERLRAAGLATGDLALALFFYGGIAAGVVMTGLADSLDANLTSYLFGSILTVSPGEVLLVVALGAIVAGAVLAVAPALYAMAVDEEWARVAGLPVGLLNSALAALVAVTIVASMRVVGILLVAALMVMPVATAQQLGRSQSAVLRWAAAIGATSALVGLALARILGLAPGGTIVLVSVVAFAVVSVLGVGGRRHAIPVPIRSHKH
jgi:zinc transport system permease protein